MRWNLTIAAILRFSFALAAIYCFGTGFTSPCFSENADGATNTESRGFEVSFFPGSQDAEGRFMGGTEIRSLVAHAGKLFAGNGYWEDESEASRGAQIFLYWTDRADDGA